LSAAQDLIISFIRSADKSGAANKTSLVFPNGAAKYHSSCSVDKLLKDNPNHFVDVTPGEERNGHKDGASYGLSTDTLNRRTSLVVPQSPQEVVQLMNISLPKAGLGHDGFLKEARKILQYSVNTWDSGFMSKLYASTDAPGLAAELILASLNTQVHTYQVSPALTIIEKHVTRVLATLFGFTGPHAGGITVQGGAASNTTSVVIARNTLYPDTKKHGNSAKGLKLLLFTSVNGHYSIEKAAMMLGFGSSAIWPVAVDSETGRMNPAALSSLILKAKREGYTPFFLNATARTTVLGSYDPFPELSKICQEHNIWLHIDASWGGPVIFSPTQKHKLNGCHLANSIAINPHKMMGVPVTCSFLLSPDVRQFHTSNTSSAKYLFHSDEPSSDVYDLADLTLQCGRKGDSLKLYLSWVYHGTDGYMKQIDAAFDTTAYLTDIVSKHPDLVLVSENPPPCCQVCFYYAKGRRLSQNGECNSTVTRKIVQGLIPRGFMIDYAGDDERGSFLRPVVSRGTGKEVVESLVESIVDLGSEATKTSQ